jgi:hypothetical protein
MAKVAIGFTVKSGWASAVVVTGTAGEPRVVAAMRVYLADPDHEDAKQPYHDGFATMRKPSAMLTHLLAAVNKFGHREVRTLIAAQQKAGHAVRGAGIVVGSLIDPSTIGNEHIRIHAMEGQLFRGVIIQACEAAKVPRLVIRQRDLFKQAGKVLGLSEARLKVRLTDLGAEVEGSWRAEQKMAALAAWLVLAGGVG